MNDLIIIGASGFGREVAWLVERINKQKETWNLLGFIDDNIELQGKRINGYEVLGNCKACQNYPNAYYVCAIGASKTRKQIIQELDNYNKNIQFATLIDPSVIISDLVEVGEGTIICAGTIATVNISIGKHVIINLDCTIGHDAKVDDYVTLYPSVNVSGNVIIHSCTELGTGVQIKQGKEICSNCLVGAGALIVDDLYNEGTYVGVPVKL